LIDSLIKLKLVVKVGRLLSLLFVGGGAVERGNDDDGEENWRWRSVETESRLIKSR